MFWKVRATPSAAISLGRLRGDVAALERDAPGVRLVEARDHVEQRGLAGAVRADDGDDAALGDVDRYVVDRGDAAEALATPSTDIWTVIAVMRSALSAMFMRGPRDHDRDRTYNRARTRLQTATCGRLNGPKRRSVVTNETLPEVLATFLCAVFSWC